MLRIAMKNLMRNKSRSILALVGLVLGVTTIIALISITVGIDNYVTNTVSKIKGIIVYEKDVSFLPLSRIDEQTIEKIEKIDGVRDVAPRVFVTVMRIDDKGGGISGFKEMIRVYGIDPIRESKTRKGQHPLGSELLRGRWLALGDKYAVILDENIADDYKKTVGSKIKLNDYTFKVVGITKEMGGMIPGSATIPLDIAREMAGIKQNEVTALLVEPDHPEETERIADLIEMQIDGVDAKPTEEYAKQIATVLNYIDALFWIVSSIAVFVAGIGILNTMLMSVLERTKEFGVLKAVGWTEEDIIVLVLSESFLLGVIGAIIGTLSGAIVVEIAKHYLGIPMAISTNLVIYAWCFSIIVGVLGGIYPAWRASKLDPIEAIGVG